MDATAVMPTDGNVTIRVLCRNRRLLLYCAVTVRLLLSAEANPQFMDLNGQWISFLVPWERIQQMSMCQCDEQYARERVPLWDRKSISAELL